MLVLICFAAAAVVLALACLICLFKRKLQERRGREEFERREDSTNMIVRLREAFESDGLSLAGDQSSQFS